MKDSCRLWRLTSWVTGFAVCLCIVTGVIGVFPQNLDSSLLTTQGYCIKTFGSRLISSRALHLDFDNNTLPEEATQQRSSDTSMLSHSLSLQFYGGDLSSFMIPLTQPWSLTIYTHIYVCMHVCMGVCMYVCMYKSFAKNVSYLFLIA